MAKVAKRRSKPLVFIYNGQEISFEMTKVDRSQLYGYKETEVVDEDGRQCELATLADDGKTLIGKGGTGIGQLTADGRWCEKSELIPVDLEGQKIEPVGSSYAAPILLDGETSLDSFLNHNIRLCYQMEASEISDELLKKLKSGSIFQFPYSYRGGLEADAGFLLTNSEDDIFFLVGDPVKFAFVGLAQPAAAATDLDAADDDSESDLMDFDMI